MPRKPSGRPTGRPAKPFQHYLQRNERSGCVEWIGCRARGGYGQVSRNGKMVYAHRVAFEESHGEIPEGQSVLHKCDNPACCNPDHLFLGTHQENMTDKVRKGRQASLPGEKNPSAKLTKEKVVQLRRLAESGSTPKELSDLFGVTAAAVYLIVRRKKWAHVP